MKVGLMKLRMMATHTGAQDDKEDEQGGCFEVIYSSYFAESI